MKKSIILSVFLVTIFISLLSSCKKNGETLVGTVYYGKTFIPIEGVLVEIGGNTGKTDSYGKFSISGINAGTQNLIARMEGFDDYTSSLSIPYHNSFDFKMTSSTRTYKVYGKVNSIRLAGNSPLEGCKVTLINFPESNTENDDLSELTTHTSAEGNYALEGVPEGYRKIRFVVQNYGVIDTSIFVENSELEFNLGVFTDIGESYQGGIIAYVYQPGDPGFIEDEIHGLIVYPQKLGPAPWGCADIIIGGTASEMGSGISNTTKIIDGCAEAVTAASLCDQLIVSSYSDWFLPGKYELEKIFSNKSRLLNSDFESIFGNYYYWTSTEYNGRFARLQSFNDGGHYLTNKSYENYVIAVREF